MHLTTMKQSHLINGRILVIGLLVVVAGVSESFGQQQKSLTQEEIAEILADVEPRVYCSHALNLVMRQVCAFKDRFNSKSRTEKKSYNNDLEAFDSFDVDRIGAAGNYDDYMIGENYQIVQGPRGYRSPPRGGIIEECCKKPCHKYQLIRFCRSQ